MLNSIILINFRLIDFFNMIKIFIKFIMKELYFVINQLFYFKKFILF